MAARLGAQINEIGARGLGIGIGEKTRAISREAGIERMLALGIAKQNHALAACNLTYAEMIITRAAMHNRQSPARSRIRDIGQRCNIKAVMARAEENLSRFKPAGKKPAILRYQPLGTRQ